MAPRTVLLIAFHFPPVQGSSGLQRTLRFAQHLPKFDWQPIVLTVSPHAYEATAVGKGNETPESLEVHRAFGLDTARHLSIFGRYPLSLAIPDRWATWRFRAIPKALHLIAQKKIDAIWSTFPIATAHAIALQVAQRTRLPWIAEFRDPMWQGDYPPNPTINAAWLKLEGEIFRQASKVVVTTPGALSEYEKRFASTVGDKLALIENGYDEETFLRAEALIGAGGSRTTTTAKPLRFLHSGIVYPEERDPSQLFKALASLKGKGAIDASVLSFTLRASGNETAYRRDIAALRIDDIVRLEPSIDYLSALEEMLAVDALVILQASNCNAQVPAKLYEYLRANRPILALTDPQGDTARTLNAAGAGLIAQLDSADRIETAIVSLIEQIRADTWRRPSSETIRSYARESQAGQLASILNALAGTGPGGR